MDLKKESEKLSLRRDELAILVIDMQNDFVDEKGKFASKGLPSMAKDIIEPLSRVIQAARKVEIPIVYTKAVYRSDYLDGSRTFAMSRKLGALIKGSWGSEIIEKLKPQEGDFIVEKHRFSAFYNTDLEIILRGLVVKTLILTGVATNVCVESTVRDAQFRDFNVIVLRDCTASFNHEMHEASLICIEGFFGVVSTSKEIINMIEEINQ